VYYKYGLSRQDKLKSRLRRFAKLYANMLLNGDIDWIKLGNVYNTKEKLPDVKAKKLVKQGIVQEMVTDEILKIYNDNGITPDFILKERLNVLNAAKEKGDLSNANKVLESFENKLIDNKEVKTTQTEVISFTNMLETGEKVKITGKQVKQLENKAHKSIESQDNNQVNDNV